MKCGNSATTHLAPTSKHNKFSAQIVGIERGREGEKCTHKNICRLCLVFVCAAGTKRTQRKLATKPKAAAALSLPLFVLSAAVAVTASAVALAGREICAQIDDTRNRSKNSSPTHTHTLTDTDKGTAQRRVMQIKRLLQIVEQARHTHTLTYSHTHSETFVVSFLRALAFVCESCFCCQLNLFPLLFLSSLLSLSRAITSWPRHSNQAPQCERI